LSILLFYLISPAYMHRNILNKYVVLLMRTRFLYQIFVLLSIVNNNEYAFVIKNCFYYYLALLMSEVLMVS